VTPQPDLAFLLPSKRIGWVKKRDRTKGQGLQGREKALGSGGGKNCYSWLDEKKEKRKGSKKKQKKVRKQEGILKAEQKGGKTKEKKSWYVGGGDL